MSQVQPQPQALKPCDGCLYGGPKVGWKGNPAAELIIVGESPGANEIKKGFPFAGVSGTILHNIIPDDDNIFVTNALQCLPGRTKGKKDPVKMTKCGHACNARLMAEVKAHPRKLIVALGNSAIQSLTGNYGYKITQIRGAVIESPLSEYGILPVIHPAALLRGTGSYRLFKDDLQYAQSIIATGKFKNYKLPVVNIPKCFADVEDYVAKLAIAELITCDIETSGFSPLTDRILTIGLGDIATPEVTYNIPRHLFQLDVLRKIFDTKRFSYHNGKFDVAFLRAYGFDKAKVDEDTMLLHYCIDEYPGGHDLEQVASDELGAPRYKDVLKPWLPNKKSSYELVPLPVLCKYMADDVSNTGQLFKPLRTRVEADPALETLYTKTLLPASEMLLHVEKRGFCIDMERVRENAIDYQRQQDDLRNELCELNGAPLNPNSPPQVAVMLFDKFRLKARGRGKGRSTAKEVLEKLPNHPAVKALRKYRKISKANSTYIKPLIVGEDSRPDGRVHPTFLIHGTPTGRLACRHPNLQNIPRVPALKGMYVAEPGRCIIDGDLNQAELRSLAALSHDQALLNIFNEGRSLHDDLSIHLFGDDYTGEQRMRAKAVNFGIVYGRSANSLAEEFDLKVAEAQRWIDGWFELYPDAKKFIDQCRAAPINSLNMVTVFGRRKRYGVVTRQNLQALQNESANFPHQSIASDINLHAAMKAQPLLWELDAHIQNLVHDSIIVEYPDNRDVERDVARILIECQESIAPKWGINIVPFLADCKVGTRWGSLEAYTP